MQTKSKILVTGGAGFIGSNLVNRLLSRGYDVTIFDNLSRHGCQANLAWIREQHGQAAFRLVFGDVREQEAVSRAARGMDAIFHLAAQVAVTTSVTDPRTDFEINALGTFNTLEAARLSGGNPLFVFSSTNKVYGSMEDTAVVEHKSRHAFRDLPLGVSEIHPLDFHSPYGCSKGCADQYVRDYARIYDLRSVVARQSCIYGYRQFGVEDQGWIAWFIIAGLQDLPITIYGDGKQVRDVLFIDDLIDFYQAALEHADITAGKVYNVGGGPQNTLSVWCEFAPRLEELLGRKITVRFAAARAGDQPVYISDIRKATRELGWLPQVEVNDGIERLFNWVKSNPGLFTQTSH